MAKAYVNSLRDTAVLTALTDAVADALARQPLSVILPVDSEARDVQQRQLRLFRRLVMAAQLVTEDELQEADE